MKIEITEAMSVDRANDVIEKVNKLADDLSLEATLTFSNLTLKCKMKPLSVDIAKDAEVLFGDILDVSEDLEAPDRTIDEVMLHAEHVAKPELYKSK